MATQFFVVDIKHPSGEDLPILLDRNRMPVTPVNEYVMSVRRTRVTPNTIRRELFVYGYLFDWARERGIDLMQRLLSGEGLTHDEVESSLFPYMRKDFSRGKVTKMIVCREVIDYRMNTVREFITRQMKATISRLPVADPRISHIEAKIKALEAAIDGLITVVQPRQKKKDALPPEKIKRLLEICSPRHPENPWKPIYQERNYLILVVLLTFGFRRGEMLKIYVSDCKLTRVIPEIHAIRRPDDKNDQRAKAPQVKTESRTLPCDRFLARRLQDYIVNERSRIPGAKKTPFLILSRSGAAMSLIRVNSMIAQIGKIHPEFKGLTPHIFRHTATTITRQIAYTRGLPTERVKEHLKYLNGWRSDQEGIYANAAIQQEIKDLSLSYQRAVFGAQEDTTY